MLYKMTNNNNSISTGLILLTPTVHIYHNSNSNIFSFSQTGELNAKITENIFVLCRICKLNFCRKAFV